tara:strand:- start:102 stop:431 length:330 start_codon:yes stop_codon:yes gene_type:complete
MFKKLSFDKSKVGGGSPLFSKGSMRREVLDTICIYDNPISMNREYWQNKKRIGSVDSIALIGASEIQGIDRITKLLIGFGEFMPAKVRGDIDALNRRCNRRAVAELQKN